MRHPTLIRWEKAQSMMNHDLWAARYLYWRFLSSAKWTDDDFKMVYGDKAHYRARKQYYDAQ